MYDARRGVPDRPVFDAFGVEHRSVGDAGEPEEVLSDKRQRSCCDKNIGPDALQISFCWIILSRLCASIREMTLWCIRHDSADPTGRGLRRSDRTRSDMDGLCMGEKRDCDMDD